MTDEFRPEYTYGCVYIYLYIYKCIYSSACTIFDAPKPARVRAAASETAISKKDYPPTDILKYASSRVCFFGTSQKMTIALYYNGTENKLCKLRKAELFSPRIYKTFAILH